MRVGGRERENVSEKHSDSTKSMVERRNEIEGKKKSVRSKQSITCERVRDVHPPARPDLPEQHAHHALPCVSGHARVVVDDG